MPSIKPLVGVVHLQPLLSSSRGGGGFEKILEGALADARSLAEGGADGVMVENFGDAPFRKGTREDPVSPDVPAALAVVAHEIRRVFDLPVGINCLRNDAMAALAAAAVGGATWVRVNVLAGSFITDQGQIDGEAARVQEFRRRLGAEVTVLADLFVKHAQPIAPSSLSDAALDLVERAGADALIVSGSRTGASVDKDFLEEVRKSVGEFPIWIGSGLCEENAAQLWPLCDGAIVGTALKRDGQVSQPVDPDRVKRLRELL